MLTLRKSTYCKCSLAFLIVQSTRKTEDDSRDGNAHTLVSKIFGNLVDLIDNASLSLNRCDISTTTTSA